jgi:hypothetical protein
LAPFNRGGLNSTHFHGTHVPVEEPSTASKADGQTRTSRVLFDHLVGNQQKVARNCQAEYFGCLQIDY